MEKVINSAATYYALFSIGLFVVVTMIYCSIGVDGDPVWWAVDKTNDRLFAINLLFITSFIFRDYVYRLFVYNAMLYMALYLSYELMYILGVKGIEPDYFLWISLFYWMIASILFLFFYVCKRNNE